MKTRFMQFSALVVAFGFLARTALGGGAGEKLGDKEFVVQALSRGIMEEKLAERAAKNGQSKEVRDYAQRLCEDHTKANKRLMTIASEMRLGVVAGADKESKEIRDRFSRLEGAAFDREFVTHMVKGHERAIRMYESQAKNATNATLRTYATETLPTLREHLKMARTLADAQKNAK